MKIPKKLRIYGADWKVIKDDDLTPLGRVDFSQQTITIRPYTDSDDADTLLHEIMEVVMSNSQCAYSARDGSDHFFLSHRDFQKVMTDFTAILLDNRLI